MITRPDDTALSDAQLLTLHLQSSTNQYIGILYARYIPLVYGVCLKYLRSTAQADDAVTAIFEELVAKIRRYRIEEFRPWLYTVSKNHCFQLLRRKKQEIPVDFSDRIMENASLVHLLSTAEEENREPQLLALEQCLEKLPENQRTCIRLFFFQHHSYADIATQTRYRLGSVKSYIQNGKRNLRICIETGNHATA